MPLAPWSHMQSRASGLISILAVACSAACAGSSSPSAPDSGGTPSRGQAVSAVDGAAIAGISVKVGDKDWITPDSSGYFQADVSGAGDYPLVVRGNSVVERQTRVTLSPTDAARVTLIPTSFDLGAYDQMMRTANGRLQRWTTQPALVVLGSVMLFSGSYGDQFNATSERLTDDEIADMITHLKEGLSMWSGRTYDTFSSIDVERPGGGDRVDVYRAGVIVVGRYRGLRSLGNTIGYGTWAETAQGAVAGGTIWLDRDFDKDDGQRRLLRIHELGHAMGYLHVTARTSVMNPSIGPEPTDFDRAAGMIAFQRPVGNVSPDIDPGAASPSRPWSLVSEQSIRWAPGLP